MFETLMAIFATCINRFVTEERSLILSNVSERCLCGALMLILNDIIKKSEFAQYYTDIEYNRNLGSLKTIINDKQQVINITCDLILHSRGQQTQDNLIALEMKKAPGASADNDKIRLQALTQSNDATNMLYDFQQSSSRHVCGYVLGVFYQINLPMKTIEIEYFANGLSHSRSVISLV